MSMVDVDDSCQFSADSQPKSTNYKTKKNEYCTLQAYRIPTLKNLPANHKQQFRILLKVIIINDYMT